MTGNAIIKLPPPAEVRSLVALMIGEIGDLLVTYPTLKALKVLYPNASLTLIARPALKELVLAQPAVDEFMPFSSSSHASKAMFLAKLLTRRFDMWVDLHTPTYNTCCSNEKIFRRNALLMRFAGARFRLGFAISPLGTRLTHEVPVPRDDILQNENIVDTTLRLAGQAGQRGWTKSLKLPKSVSDRMIVRLDLEADSRPLLALFFGAKQSAKFWPEENILHFMNLILNSYPEHRLVLVGGPHEDAIAKRLISSLNRSSAKNIVNLTNQCSLLETAAVIHQCQAMITTDSGPMHIADAVDIPIVALFSAFSYLPIWLPLTKNKAVLNHRPLCSPCFTSVCDKDNECMRAITPEQVLQSLASLLNRKTCDDDQ